MALTPQSHASQDVVAAVTRLYEPARSGRAGVHHDIVFIGSVNGCLLVRQTDPGSDASGRDVAGGNDRGEAWCVQGFAGVVAHCGGRFSCESFTLPVGADVITDLQLVDAVEALQGESTVPDEHSGDAVLKYPQAESVVAVGGAGSIDPGLCLLPAARPGVVRHHHRVV
jgi:hypothetical protein